MVSEEYSCPFFVGLCLPVCMTVYTITKKCIINLKLAHAVGYGNSLDEFDIGIF